MGGAVLGLLAVMLLGNVVSSPIVVMAVAMVAYVSVGALLFLLAGPARVQVRLCQCSHAWNRRPATSIRRYTEWQTVVQMLIRADHMLATGAISSAEHEAIWSGSLRPSRRDCPCLTLCRRFPWPSRQHQRC